MPVGILVDGPRVLAGGRRDVPFGTWREASGRRAALETKAVRPVKIIGKSLAAVVHEGTWLFYTLHILTVLALLRHPPGRLVSQWWR